MRRCFKEEPGAPTEWEHFRLGRGKGETEGREVTRV